MCQALCKVLVEWKHQLSSNLNSDEEDPSCNVHQNEMGSRKEIQALSWRAVGGGALGEMHKVLPPVPAGAQTMVSLVRAGALSCGGGRIFPLAF